MTMWLVIGGVALIVIIYGRERIIGIIKKYGKYKEKAETMMEIQKDQVGRKKTSAKERAKSNAEWIGSGRKPK